MEERMTIKVRLGSMMFLEYAIWGAWFSVLSEYLLNDLGFTGIQAGIIYGMLPLGTIISPFIFGQLADRYFSSEKIIAYLQLIGGALLIYMSLITSYTSMKWLMLMYCILYAPTLALTNSIAFMNLENSEEEFGKIRVWGSIGWIAAGLTMVIWRLLAKSIPALDIGGDMLLLSGILSLAMGIHSFALPHTPPKKEGANPWAFVDALKMLKNKNFLIFVVIAFVVSTELMIYFLLTGPFLVSDKIGVDDSMLSGVMVIAQIAEILVMALLLPKVLPKYGIRKVMVIGVLAWPVRYIVFAIGAPAWLVIASLALHGFCYVFFFTVAFIYVDTIAPKDTRHSAQSMITLIMLGLGLYLGSIFAGRVQSFFTVDGVTNWTGVFLVPVVLTILCAGAFVLFFKEEQAPKHTES